MADALICPLPVVCGVVGQGARGFGGAIVGALASAIAGWFVAVARWLLDLVAGQLVHSTTPPITQHWFLMRERLVVVAAAPIALLALVAGTVHALLHGSLGDLARTALLRVPVALVLGAAGAGLVGLAVAATDALSASLAAGTPTSLPGALHAIATASLATGQPGVAAGLVGAVVALGAFVLWIELVVRAAAITVGTALLPLILATSLWPPAVAWAKRLAETLGALIVSKAVIVLVLSIALDAVANAGAGASSALTGAAMLLLAAFAPFVVLRLVPAIEGAAVLHLEGVRRRATGAAAQATGRAVSLATGSAGGAIAPSIDAVGSNPIGLLPGVDADVTSGTCLDPTFRPPRGPSPRKAIPASAGRHVWKHDKWGPRVVWVPPWELDK
jgi:hypothetical protein